jgi:hypothetical protein
MPMFVMVGTVARPGVIADLTSQPTMIGCMNGLALTIPSHAVVSGLLRDHCDAFLSLRCSMPV